MGCHLLSLDIRATPSSPQLSLAQVLKSFSCCCPPAWSGHPACPLWASALRFRADTLMPLAAAQPHTPMPRLAFLQDIWAHPAPTLVPPAQPVSLHCSPSQQRYLQKPKPGRTWLTPPLATPFQAAASLSALCPCCHISCRFGDGPDPTDSPVPACPSPASPPPTSAPSCSQS